MHVIADLQLHSRFSRAVSPQMTIPNIAMWARRKGIGLIATGDWTHPLWMREIEKDLEEVGNGLLRLKDAAVTGSAVLALRSQNPLFLLATEVSSIYTQNGKVRRVHTLIWVPTVQSARKISQEMTRRGCNLMSDGRPIIGLTSIQVAELVFSVEPQALIIPAHAWTPWFSVYGSMGGFDTIEEAFGPFAKQIYAIETGLSSNPSMNWRIKELDDRSIVSFSDAHSGPKLGREATVFELPELSYENIYQAIKGENTEPLSFPRTRESINGLQSSTMDPRLRGDDKKEKDIPVSHIAYTIEFYPEEGKYHYTGHRACNIRLTPEDSKKKGTGCPVCGKPLTQGVMQRVEELAGRSEADLQIFNFQFPLRSSGQAILNNKTIQVTRSKAFPNRPPFVMLVPLQEIIAEAVGSPVASPKVQGPYQTLTDALGGEFTVLLSASISEIAKASNDRIAQGIDKVRRGDIVIDPGYDGVFGVVKIWKEGEEKPLLDSSKEQLAMF